MCHCPPSKFQLTTANIIAKPLLSPISLSVRRPFLNTMAPLSQTHQAKHASRDAPPTKTNPLNNPGNSKRKMDWDSIDENKAFKGFTLKAVAPRRPSNKRQKTGAGARGATGSEKDASRIAEINEENPYKETKLNTIHCQVVPARLWESTDRFRSFTSKSHFVLTSLDMHCRPDTMPRVLT